MSEGRWPSSSGGFREDIEARQLVLTNPRLKVAGCLRSAASRNHFYQSSFSLRFNPALFEGKTPIRTAVHLTLVRCSVAVMITTIALRSSSGNGESCCDKNQLFYASTMNGTSSSATKNCSKAPVTKSWPPPMEATASKCSTRTLWTR